MSSTFYVLWLRVRRARVGLLRLALLVLACGLLFTKPILFKIQPYYASLFPQSPLQSVSDEVDIAVLRGLSYPHNQTRFSRCNINVRFDSAASNQNRTTRVDAQIPEFIPINFNRDENEVQGLVEKASARCSFEVVMPPPQKRRTDASHLLFGVATTLERLENSVEMFSYWAGHTGATVVALIEPDEEAAISAVKQKASGFGYNLTILQHEGMWEDRYFDLTKHLYEQRQLKSKWGILIDDDTFFLSPSRLVNRLAEYDPSKQHYLGGLTEDYWQTLSYGYMAYGGAGVFLSMPLLAKLHEFYDECKEYYLTGDRKLAECIYLHTLTKFHPLDGFHQLDMHGDLSGFYESGRELPLSIHHWKSWHSTPVDALSAVSSVCGDACLLHRLRFGNDWFLTNGYSLVRYSDARPDDDITMERTWWDLGEYQHSLEPLRPKDEEKVSLRLIGTLKEEGEARQFYVYDEEGLAWIFEAVWKTKGHSHLKFF